MKTKIQMEELERCHTIAIQDVTLKVIAQHVEDGEWELCVENSHGIKAIWSDLYESPEAAISAGLTAIETEGHEEFSGTEGFDYLLESEGYV